MIKIEVNIEEEAKAGLAKQRRFAREEAEWHKKDYGLNAKRKKNLKNQKEKKNKFRDLLNNNK